MNSSTKLQTKQTTTDKTKNMSENCPQSLINGLATIITYNAVSPKVANAILDLLKDYFTGIPRTVGALLNKADLQQDPPVKPPSPEHSYTYNEEDKFVLGQRRIETKIEEMHREMKEQFNKLEGLIQESAKVAEEDLESKPIEQKVALSCKLPIKDLTDLEFVEDRLHDSLSTDIDELESYLNSFLLKGADVDACALSLVEKIFWKGFLSNTFDATELLETKVLNEVVENVLQRFPKSPKEKVINVIRTFLKTFEEDSTPVRKKRKVSSPEHMAIEEVIVGDDHLDEIGVETESDYYNEDTSTHVKQEATEYQRRNFNLYVSPINSLDELKAFEEHLRHNDALGDFRNYLDTLFFKGTSFRRYIKSVFKAVFSSDFLPNCRWASRGSGQVALKQTIMCQLLVRKVKEEFPELAESTIHAKTSQFLRTQGHYHSKSKVNKTL